MTGILEGMRIVEGSAFVAAPLGGHDAGAARRRRHPLRPDRRRPRPQALAGHRRRPEPLLGRAEQGQALDRGRPAPPTRAASSLAAARSPRPGPTAGLFLTNFPARGLARLRGACRAPARPDHGQRRRQPRRLVGGRLHGQPGDGLPLGHRARGTSGVPFNHLLPGVGRDHGRRWPRPACWPPSASGGRTGEGQLVRLALSDVAFCDGRQPRQDRRGAGRTPRAAEGRQLPLRRVRARLPRRRTGGA